MPFPVPGAPMTHMLVVSDFALSVAWYRDVLGAELDREYGGTSAVFSFNGAWLLVVTGGEPTPDKPNTRFVPPSDVDRVSHAMTIRVPDCRAAYDELVQRGPSSSRHRSTTAPRRVVFSATPTGICSRSANSAAKVGRLVPRSLRSASTKRSRNMSVITVPRC